MGRWVQQIGCETRTLSYFPSQNGPGLWWVVSCCIMPLISWVDCFLKQSLAKGLSYQSLESALVGRDLGLVNASFRSSLKIHWQTRPLRPRYRETKRNRRYILLLSPQCISATMHVECSQNSQILRKWQGWVPENTCCWHKRHISARSS